MKRQKNQFCVAPAFFLVILGISSLLTAQPLTPKQQAEQILKACNIKGGLIVHIGCGDGRLTAALCRGQVYRVHGLDADAVDIQQAREFIRSSGLYGAVSVEHWDGLRLPYGDNLVNLLVAEQLGQIPMSEVMRVLVPRGVAYVKHGNTWRKDIKPRPQNVDEWTHFLHDASGNAVAHDAVVGPPRYVQWIAEPRHTRSHEHIPSINALVSADGRIFYIADQAPIASIRGSARWYLIARDAYNGILLWKRSFGPWFPYIINWGQTPRQLQRKLVAVGNRVYVTLGLHAPLSVVDAATGETLKVYEQTQGTEEIVCHKEILLLAVRSVTDERVAELAKWAKLTEHKESPLYARDTAEPLVNRFRAIEAKAEIAVLALDADTGRLLWKKTGANTAELRTLSLCANADCVFYQNGKDVVCLDLRTGRELWSVPSAPLRMVYDSSVFCADGQTVTALSAETGKSRWTQPASLCDIRDAFVINGSLWLGGFKPWPGEKKKYTGPVWGAYFVTQRDLATGKILMHIEPENPGHHHRCYVNKATDRYILGGRRGTEFIDLQSGDVLWHSWVRGICKYGVMPCNGLLYAPPHACACYVGTKVTGFFALASEQESTDRSAGARLEIGPSCDVADASAARADSGGTGDEDGQHTRDGWPTYRHDAQRSGSTRSAVSANLQPRWQTHVGGRLSSPTVAKGRVFVACRDRHEVIAIESDSGTAAWTFTAGGRVDSPPTIHGDRALFGCRDGYVYCLRTSDGSLAWRFRSDRTPRRIMARGQLESALPVHGSVLVQNDVAYFTMGRSSYLDGGIDLYRLDPGTGQMLSRTRVYSPDPKTGKQPPQSAPYAMPGVRSDILTGDGEHVYLRDMVFDNRGAHLLTLTGFLDDSWPHRSYWIFGTHCSISTGCSRRDRDLVSGRLLVFDESTIYGYGRKVYHWSNQLQDGPYELFAYDQQGQGKQQWARPVPLQIRAMILAHNILFAAGSPVETENGPGAPDKAADALLLAVAASNGATLAQYRLEAAPVLDGLAAVENHLYMTLENGSIVCMEAEGQ
ncbi:MAG: outer membrane protein assembly factor BamB family protein [Planctomycetota bacterium]|jgi:outer membrane protein assembly factor BamB